MIAGVGHPYLRDTSIGPVLVPRLKEMEWPDGIEIYDLHFGPIHVVQWLEEKPGYFGRVVFLSGVARGHKPGSVNVYRWDGALPGAEEIQQRICEAVTGIIGLDNLLIIGGHFGVWPDQVGVIEVEPLDEEFGAELSGPVEAAVPMVLGAVRRLALEPLDDLHMAPIAGIPTHASVVGSLSSGISNILEAQRWR